MKKSSIFILTLSIILTLFVAVACSNETAVVEDQLAYVSFGKSGSRAFTTGLSNAPGKDDLFWTYTATKTDGKLNTGAGTQNITGKGISNKQVGPFSVGTWQFTLKGYAEDTHATLVYDGTSDIVTLTAGTNNAIDVNVVYQPKGGNGKLKLDNVYFDYTGSNVITKLKLDLRNVDSSADSNTYSFEVTNLNPSETPTKFSLDEKTMKAGVYEAKFYFFIGDTLAYTPFIQNIVVLNNRTTTVSGCITEDQAVDQTFNVTTTDYGYVESAGKYYVYVSDEKALQNALNAAGVNREAVVVLTCDIDTDFIEVGAAASRSINASILNDISIDLNGYNITKNSTSTVSELIKMNATNRTLTIMNSKSTGSIDAGTSTVATVESGTLKIESGKLSGSVAVKVEAGASAEITGGQLKATGTAIQNGGVLRIQGGTISGSTAIQVTHNDATTVVESGKLDANTTVSKDETVTGNVDVTIRDDVEIKEGASISEDITPKKYTGTGSESDPYCVGSQEAINEVLELITTTTNTTYVKVIKSFEVNDTITVSCNLNIDLNGNTITGNLSSKGGSNSVIDVDNSSIEIKDSVGTGKIISDEYGIGASEGGTITVVNGTIESNYAALAGNNTTGDMNFVVNGGTLTSKLSEAIYMPGQQTLNITNGTINGGISARMGQINISGGTINGMTSEKASDSFDEYWDYSGSAWIGDAIYVWGGTYTSDNAVYGNSCNIVITGGMINGNAHNAIAVYDIANKYDQFITVSVSGDAVVNGTIVEDHSHDQGTKSVTTAWNITGGIFSSDPSSYTGDCSAAISNTDGTFKVVSISENEDGEYEISSVDQLVVFGKLVNEKGKTFTGKTGKLTANIDLAGIEWKPVGQTGGYTAKTYFQGTFDGDGHTISNLYIPESTWEAGPDNLGRNYATGFFGFIDEGGNTIKNVTFDNATVEGHHWVGVVTGYMTGTVSGVTVKDSSITSTYKTSEADGDKAGGVVGYLNKGSITGCTVTGSTISAVRDCGSVAGYSTAAGNVTGNKASDCTVYFSTDNEMQIGGKIAGQRAEGVSSNESVNVSLIKLVSTAESLSLSLEKDYISDVTVVLANDLEVLTSSGTINYWCGGVETSKKYRTSNYAFLIGKSVKINGNGYSIIDKRTNGSYDSLFAINGDNLNVSFEKLKATTNNMSTIILNDDSMNARVSVTNCELTAKSYTIKTCNGTDRMNLTIENSSLYGWAALNLRSSHSNVTISESNLAGFNSSSESPWNNYASLVLDGDSLFSKTNSKYGSNNTVVIKKSIISAETESSNKQTWLAIQYGAANNTVTVDNDCTINPDSSWTYCVEDGGTDVHDTNTVTIKGNKVGGTAD